MNKSKQSISIVVPVYNNYASLEELHNLFLDQWELNFSDLSLEVVYVDDGSRDDSWNLILELQKQYPNIVSSYKLSRNFGQLSAMLAGYQKARGDVIASISADLQDPPELISEMVKLWKQGNQVVIANRASRKDSFFSQLTSKIAYYFASKSNPGMPKGGFDYFLMSRKAVDLLLQFNGRFRFIQGDLLWLGLPTTFLPYERRARPHGKSGYTFLKRFSNFVDIILDSSDLPIKIMSWSGVAASLLALFFLTTIIVAWFNGDTPFQGWAPIMITMLVLNGTLMIMLSTIGAYLWRIYDQLRGRPSNVFISENPIITERG